MGNPFFDRTSSAQGGTVGSDQWNEATEFLQLTDLFRNFHPRKRLYTLYSVPHKMQCRIDRAYCSKDAVPFTGSCNHISIPSIISDHIAGVEFVIRGINCATRGPSYWRLNVSLMKRPGFEKIVKNIIADFKTSKDRYPDLATWWDMLKLAL